MEITEVRVKLVDGKQQDKLKAFCSITIDHAFVIRDLKIIEGAKGLFVAMPSRKITTRCEACGGKNQIGARFCSQCGSSQPPERGGRGRDGRLKLHADIAHPIHSSCRESIQARVLESYESEVLASEQPGYQPPSFDDFDQPEEDEVAVESPQPRFQAPPRARRVEPLAPEPRPTLVPENHHRDEKSVETGNPPPDDNFGAGLF
ncbi:MAG: septation protein SpoVG family protein [Planctomycetota bacterium]